MKRIGFLGMFCLMLMACQTNDVFQWNKQSDGYILRTGKIPPQRLSAAGYGEYMPIADNTSSGGRLLNRRVDIIILK